MFCLENFPGGVPALVGEFASVIGDPEVRTILSDLAVKFRDEEASGLRAVVEVEEPMGDARAIRKFQVFTIVDDFCARSAWCGDAAGETTTAANGIACADDQF